MPSQKLFRVVVKEEGKGSGEEDGGRQAYSEGKTRPPLEGEENRERCAMVRA